MPKGNGLGQNLYIGGYDVTNDIGQINSMDIVTALEERTGLDKFAVERGSLRKTSALSFTGWYNDTALKSHAALSPLPTADVVASLFAGTTLADDAAGINGKQVGYGWTRPADGSLGITSEIQSNDDYLNWGLALTAGKRTDSSGTNGSGVDYGLGDLSFGVVLYAHVFAITGTNVILTIEESQNDGGGDAYAAITGGVFTSVVAPPKAQRLQTSLTQTVEDWLRVVSSGTFSSATFAVCGKIYIAANAER